MSQITDASGDTTTYSYHPESRYTSILDGENRLTYTTYDPDGRVSAITNANTYLEQRYHTANGLLASRLDGNGNVTTYARDGFDRLAALGYADGTAERFAYTADDDLDYKLTRAGQTVQWKFDNLHRPIQKISSDPTITYGYDYAGRLLTATTPVVTGDPSSGQWQRVYDSAGRRQYDKSPDGRAVGYLWDAAGNRTGLLLWNAGSSGWNIDFASTYDALGRQISADLYGQLPELDRHLPAGRRRAGAVVGHL